MAPRIGGEQDQEERRYQAGVGNEKTEKQRERAQAVPEPVPCCLFVSCYLA